MVLDAASILLEQRQSTIKFVFAGDGFEKDSLMQRAKQEELQNCIFLDPIPKIKLRALMQRADIGLVIFADKEAFRYGTSPNKFFDYIASGLPILVNHPGWVKDLIIEEQAGVFSSPGDASEMAAKLISMSELSVDQLNSFGKNSLQLANNRFDRKTLTQQFVKIVIESADD